MCLPRADTQLSRYLLQLFLSSECRLVLAPLGLRSEIFQESSLTPAPSAHPPWSFDEVCVFPRIVCGQSTKTMIVPALHLIKKSSTCFSQVLFVESFVREESCVEFWKPWASHRSPRASWNQACILTERHKHTFGENTTQNKGNKTSKCAAFPP